MSKLFMAYGTVKWFNEAKGYGLIMSSDGNEVHVHYNSIQHDGFRTLTEGDPVSFDTEHSAKGLNAIKVVKQ